MSEGAVGMQVNKRMAAVDYSIPAFPPISGGCRAVLSQLLVKSLTERMSIDDVMEHSWFLQGLPPGWDQLNAKCLAMATQVFIYVQPAAHLVPPAVQSLSAVMVAQTTE